jgi:hypothetical protein
MYQLQNILEIVVASEFDYSCPDMPDNVPEISAGAIVLAGSFNPKIFQPEWFVRQGLLPQGEADAADIKVIVPQVCQFETERFVVQVTEGRFVAGSKPNANPAPLKDLVQGTFSILEHTPVTGMGLNCQMHIKIGSEESWHKIGDRLAPKQGWKEILEGRPGLLSMTIVTHKDKPKGSQFNVKVESSVKVQFGIYFETNEHYAAPEDDGLKNLMAILGERWEEAQIYASRVVDHILAWARKEE